MSLASLFIYQADEFMESAVAQLNIPELQKLGEQLLQVGSMDKKAVTAKPQ